MMKAARWIFLLGFALALSACSSAPEAIPTVSLDDVVGGETTSANDAPRSVNADGIVTVSGIVVPAQETRLAFAVGGNIRTVNVVVGEKVEAGQVLAELDNAIARLELERAQRALRELTSPAEIASAAEALAAAQKAFDDAQTKVEGLNYARASDTLIDNVRAEIDLAEQQLALASDAYKRLARKPDGNPQKAAALAAMTNAQLNLNALNAKYNWYTGSPSATDIALTQAKFNAAQAALQEAQWYLDALQGKAIPAEATGVKLAQWQQARADVEAAENLLGQTRLTAPFPGVVAQINVRAGEYAFPGSSSIVVSDPQRFLVKTTDLSERDVVKIQVGDPVSIVINALNQTFNGEVSHIALVADTLGGDVIYEATLIFTEQPQGAFSGMTAEARIGK